MATIRSVAAGTREAILGDGSFKGDESLFPRSQPPISAHSSPTTANWRKRVNRTAMLGLENLLSNMQVPRVQRPITMAMSQLTQGWETGDQQKFLSRIGNWFRRSQNGVAEHDHEESGSEIL